MTLFFTILGWIGTFSYLIAYFLLAKGTLSADKSIYHILNIIGGVGLLINSLHTSDYPSVVVNGIWGAIAIYMVIKTLKFQTKDES